MISHDGVGAVAALRRYPVKSMLGEALDATSVGAGGLFGDRAYALVDQTDGKIVSAKNPRKWPQLFGFHAVLASEPPAADAIPPVYITSPDGIKLSSAQPDIDAALSQVLQRHVALRSLGQSRSDGAAEAEAYWPDMDGLNFRDTVTAFELPERTFFDAAFVHVLTTATLDRLASLYPQGRFDVRRFRPNVVVDTGGAGDGFVENGWVGRTLAIGATVRLGITGPCARCVMTTLAQSDLPRDLEILRTAAAHNHAHVGVYASVLRGGSIRRGDRVTLG